MREKFPSLRFSEEISYLVTLLNKKLRSLPLESTANQSKEEIVCNQILGLLFAKPIRKVWENYDIYLYPYMSKIKQLPLVEDQIQKTQFINIGNVFHVFEKFMNGAKVFPDFSERSVPWHSELEVKMNQYQQAQGLPLLQKVMKHGKEINTIMTYKNFEMMLTHCME